MKKKTQSRINLVVDSFFDYLKFKVLGPRSLTKKQLTRLLKAKYIKLKDLGGQNISDMYLKSYVQHFPTGEASKGMASVHKNALKHITERAGRFIDGFKNKTKAKILTTVDNKLHEERNKMVADKIKPRIHEGFKNKESMESIARSLKEITGNMEKDWSRVVLTEFANASNFGSMDAIIEKNPEKSSDEIYCYKQGPNDSKTCKMCKKFWFLPDGATPKVYKLSELISNGSNYNKKQASWLPTIEVTHPNCRHLLKQIQSGYGFQGSGLEYINKDYDEFKSQET